MFTSNTVKLALLKQRAYNLRWATLPDGVIPLTAADSDFPCAEPIQEAVARYAKDGYFSYGPPEGLPELREALAVHYQEIKRVTYLPQYILPVDSAAFGIFLTCQSFLSPGDEAIIFDPVDFLFRYSVEAVGAIAVPFAIPPGTEKVDFSQLEQLVTPQTKMICLCNPLNPTGKVFTPTELLELVAVAEKHNLLILSDEIWSDIVFKPFAYTSVASLNEEARRRTITITGFSKSYGLAGLRIGAILVSNAAHFQKIYHTSLHQSTIHGSNVLGQIAATTALQECRSWLAEFMLHLQVMRDLCVTKLNEIEGFSCIAPQGCYVAFINITGTGMTSADLQKLLLEKAKVAVVPGLAQWFGEGAEGYIRLSFATSAEILEEALFRINKNLL
ncbi:pyridoxal phosphate-dependent aminotransferase [Haliscomenobacter sp.]|uniref:pyridoxal phosphate-dependent aminotransferase n=1 Tax=Haliscomenobacter sp. TaxID=2717303 RepID=UPI0033650039